ncbi:MarR family transcriptional regulator [Actinomadura sp. KC345]|uniref:MarR family winged helix-turn-helix transcriptional regulator n=1 Tax=Actinomadura sp. KC345 TaxID=2530371 RepID=UPI001045BFD0|nr:MarR family transcriptional regulator [Actinomadura sp. KC345]TDC41458.1 MarR family transcriptional regulator [Actinomadura sp. KC345]
MPTHRMDPIEEGRRNWLEHDSGPVEQISAATALTRGKQIAVRRTAAALGEHGLTFSQFEVLMALAEHAAPLGMGELGAALRLHPTTAARTVARLERAGHVERVASEHDRRVSLVRASAHGAEVTASALAGLRDIRFGLDGWDAEDVRRFTRAVAPFLTD